MPARRTVCQTSPIQVGLYHFAAKIALRLFQVVLGWEDYAEKQE